MSVPETYSTYFLNVELLLFQRISVVLAVGDPYCFFLAFTSDFCL